MNKPTRIIAYILILLSILYISKVGPFIMSALTSITAPIHCRGIILATIAAIIFFLIEILLDKYPIPNPKRIKRPTTTTPLYSDQPTSEDKYGRDTSAFLLVQKIFSTFNASQADKGSFVININEAYGFGKTSFLHIFAKHLQAQQQPYLFIDYRPWLCENEQAIVKEFFTLLSSNLKDTSLNDDIKQYTSLLLDESSKLAPWWAKIPLTLFAKTIKPNSLKETHDRIKASLQDIDRPIIVTIDDVDRLQEKELTAVLKLIRDTADFPNIFYVVAADNTHLEMMLSKMGIQNPKNYLKKFFNLDYLLPAHESVPTKILQSELEKILKSYSYPHNLIVSALMMFQRLPNMDKAYVNMREVYRFLNAYTSSLDILQHNGNLHLVDPYELFCLTIIRHLRLDIYKKLRDRNDEFLEVINRSLDACFHLKDDFNIVKIQRNKTILQHMDASRKDLPSTEERKQRQAEAEKLTLDDAVRLTETSRDKMVAFILDHLFSNVDNRDERSICRCNVYFLYFSGKVESTKLTTAESIDILKMSQPTYESALNSLFKSNKADAFISNFSYAYHQTNIGKEDAMKKFYTLLKWQFNYNSSLGKQLFDTFEDYINKGHESFIYFLFELYGRDSNDDQRQVDKATEDSLRSYCESEPDINMLTLAFFIFSQRLGNFRFGREFVNPMLNSLADRLIKERMNGINPLHDVDESTFNTMILLKDEFATNKQWDAKLEQFLCEDKNRCMQWLSSMISFYSNGHIDWNYRHHVAIMGEYADSGDHLMESIKQKFPDYSKVAEELMSFQNYRSLSGLTLSNSKYIQMAREMQQAK